MYIECKVVIFLLNALISVLPKKLDGVLILSEVNRRYFTGFPSSDGILLATRKGSVFLTDSRYIEAAREQVTCCDVEELVSTAKQLPEYCEKFGCKILGVEGERISVNELQRYRRILKPVTLTSGKTEERINRLKGVKSADEIEKIKKAQSIAEAAFRNILGFIKEGVTEKDIALELDFFMLRHGAEALSFETIAISGANTSKPHGVPTDRKVQRGDFVTMDYGAVFDGYHSDMTRTVAVGEVSSKQAEIYNTVLRAQMSALSVLRAGLKCSEADKAARDVISAAGCGDFFRHSTGHSVGVEIHELPSLSPKSKSVLESGNVVTVEPGIYIPGEFGVRIEDMALIKGDGYENLTGVSKELLIL